MEPTMYCAYCGRLSRRCRCHEPGSRLERFMARAGRPAPPSLRAQPYRRAVPPQVRRRERSALKKSYQLSYNQLAQQHPERCLNCGAVRNLVLDHVIPIAKGGRSTIDNLQLLCAECNRLKGKLVVDCRAMYR